jgi:hypothetical protein
MKANRKYYILYKIIKDEQGNIIDASNVYDFTSYEEIRNYLQCNNRDIKNIITSNIDKLENIKTLRNTYFIIKE